MSARRSSETYSADIVVVSCGAANTAKLLLESASDKHPNGLANGSDQVGRNYMFHNSQAVLAISKEPNPTVFQKTLGVNDYYFASDAWEFPMGNIQMVGKSVAAMYRGEKPLMTKLAPTFSLADVAEHAVDFWLSTEDLPQQENRVSVDRDGKLTLNYAPATTPPGTACSSSCARYWASGHARAPPDPALGLPGEQDPSGGCGPPGRHLPLWFRPSILRA